jgi:hypothetical protein
MIGVWEQLRREGEAKEAYAAVGKGDRWHLVEVRWEARG